ncbi:MAG: S9 family peptidase [Chloroflexota bacterium]|nr:S9 family peptidase [Chloroflexota bacterium]
MAQRMLNLETLLKIPYVEPDYGFDISPDGTQVAFSHNLSGLWEIYLMPVDGSTPLRRITGGPGSKFNPHWSHDGRRLAYVLDTEGGELFDVCVYDFATETHVNLTPDTPDAIQLNYAWSPDSTQIAFISDRSGHFDTYVMPSGGGPARPVLGLPHPDRDVRWSPDGRWLAIVTGAGAQDDDTFIVPAGGGEPRLVSDASGSVHAKDVRWSPEGDRLAFIANIHGRFDIGVYELETGQITWVTDGEGDEQHPAWSPDGRRLACVVSRGPATALAVSDLEQGTLATYQVEPGVHYPPRFTPDGAHLVFVFDNPHRPRDLWLLSLTGGSFRQLTDSLPPDLQGAPFVAPVAVCYPSLDGRSVPALLYRPRQDEQVERLPPAVIYVHGGPTWMTRITWDPLVQHLVSRGWVVLAPNYRGSTGYGQEWQLANRFDLGGGDTQDVVAGADYLVRERLADPARIAITGVSYGGYMTMTALTQYPDRWAAGSAVVPFLNWFTEFANERQDLQHWDRENLGDPEKDHDLYYERSPFFFLHRITAPVQLICGAHDPRCPAGESIQARDALLAQGKQCDFVLYPDEGHLFQKTRNVVDAKKRRVEFLAEALESLNEMS